MSKSLIKIVCTPPLTKQEVLIAKSGLLDRLTKFMEAAAKSSISDVEFGAAVIAEVRGISILAKELKP